MPSPGQSSHLSAELGRIVGIAGVKQRAQALLCAAGSAAVAPPALPLLQRSTISICTVRSMHNYASQQNIVANSLHVHGLVRLRIGDRHVARALRSPTCTHGIRLQVLQFGRPAMQS